MEKITSEYTLYDGAEKPEDLSIYYKDCKLEILGYCSQEELRKSPTYGDPKEYKITVSITVEEIPTALEETLQTCQKEQ